MKLSGAVRAWGRKDGGQKIGKIIESFGLFNPMPAIVKLSK